MTLIPQRYLKASLELRIGTRRAVQPTSPIAQPTDQLTLVVYNPAKHKYVFLPNAAPRSAQTVDLLLPLDFSGDVDHSYMLFVSQNGKQVSLTYYADKWNCIG